MTAASALGYPGGDPSSKSFVADRDVLRSMIEIGFARGCWDAARGHAAARSAPLVKQHHVMTLVGQSPRARQTGHARTDDPNPHQYKCLKRQETARHSTKANLV
jgi:hypothetical protein